MRRSRGELRRRRLLAPALAGLFLLFLELADEALFVDCATAAGASAAKPAHKIRSASTPTDCQRLRTTLCLLSRSEEHTSELQSRQYLVCRLLLEKKKKKNV